MQIANPLRLAVSVEVLKGRANARHVHRIHRREPWRHSGPALDAAASSGPEGQVAMELEKQRNARIPIAMTMGVILLLLVELLAMWHQIATDLH